MKKFVFKLSLFFLIIALVDYSFGLLCSFLITNSHSGETACITGILKNKKHDVLIMGSSRCVCHYDDKKMSDSLGVRVTNAGEKGNGIILMYGRYHIIPNENRPRVLLYDIEPSFDVIEYEEDDNNKRYLAGLKLFYDEDGIKEVFRKVDSKEVLKMRSRLYRYNSMIFSLLQDYMKREAVNYSRYEPSYKEYSNLVGQQKVRENDTLKLYYFEQLIKDTKTDGVQLIVVASPKFINESKDKLAPVIELCDKHNIPFWDYYSDMHDTKWFCDNMHLNYDGSQVFTQTIIDRLRTEEIDK